MILTVTQMYIFKYQPFTHRWIAKPVTYEPGPEALIHATDSLVNWRRTDVLKPTHLSSLHNNIPRWSGQKKLWQAIPLGQEKHQYGHFKI